MPAISLTMKIDSLRQTKQEIVKLHEAGKCKSKSMPNFHLVCKHIFFLFLGKHFERQSL